MSSLRSSDIHVKIGETIYCEIEEWSGDFLAESCPGEFM